MPIPYFYRILSFFCVLFFAFNGWLKAQPGPYPSGVKVNYIRTWEATAPEQNPATLITRPLKDVKQTTVYLDGLGRPLQTVVKQGSLATGSNPVDIVTPVVYDAFGREEFKYLPFAANTTGGYIINDGNFKLNPFQQQTTFGASQYPGETFYYNRVQYEKSPLNRVEKTLPAGNNWVGTNRGTVKRFWLNTGIDDVKIWAVAENPGDLATYTVTGNYAPGTLYKNVTEDEAGNQMIEFKNKSDKIILKKVQLNAASDDGTGKGYAGFLCTYFIYDDLDQLRCVIQPKGVELISSNWNLTDPVILSEQCFRYEFDSRNRMIIRKIPGAGEEYLVYDIRDRLVFLQNGNMRNMQQWKATLYDSQNRPIITGMTSYSGSREQLQSLVTTQTTGTSGSSSVQADLTLNSLTGTGSFYAINSIILDNGFETQTNANVTAELIDNNSNSDETTTLIEGIAVNRNPLPLGSTLDPLTLTYYDGYEWASSLNSNLKDFNIAGSSTFFDAPSNSTYPYAQLVAKTSAVTGLVTGTKTRILDSYPAQYITTVNFYDEHNRLQQTRTMNITGSVDVFTNQYSWSGKAIYTVLQQSKSGTNPQTHTLVTKVDYDDLNRPSIISNTVFSNIGSTTLNKPLQEIVRHEYDALGQLKKKILGGGIEQMDYDYNIRGWVLGANRNFIKSSNQRYFGFELGYDKSSTIISGTNYNTPQYSGNVSGIVWKSSGDNEVRKLDYSFDASDRLVSADFNQYTGSTFTKPNGLNFSVSNISYDANGNILTLQQNGWKLNQPGAVIDNLQYTYYDKSNKLKNVIDANNDVATKLGDFRTSQYYLNTIGGTKTNAATDYDYDANGNLAKDLNKDIGSANTNGIKYNILDLPQTIKVYKAGGEKGTISYVYDANGKKHQKIIKESGLPEIKTLYLDAAVYRNDTLQFFSNDEGRLRYGKHYFTNGDSAWEYNYDYFIKDHLDNIRMVLSEQKDTAKYAATMETAYRAREEKLFSNIAVTAYPTPEYYPVDTNVTKPNEMVIKLDGTTGKKIGPSLLLKVMSGDAIDMYVKSFYKPATKGAEGLPVSEIVSGLANSLLGAVGEAKGTLSQLTDVSSPITSGLGIFRTQNQNSYPNKPKAYLNWILFDEQFNYISASSGASAVNAADQLQVHAPGTIDIVKNGYFYIYTSNETENWNVFFNDLIVQHRFGKLMEETHYYPGGLPMAGISSKSSRPYDNKNKLKFNGKEEQRQEFSDESGLEWLDYGQRMYDNQLMRWMIPDPLADKYQDIAPYVYVLNNPTINIDPDGQDVIVRRYPTMYGYTDGKKINLPLIPKTVHDLGVTMIHNGEIKFAKNKNGKYDVSANIVQFVNPAIQPGNFLDLTNPGLGKEVAAHEKAHGDQLEESLKSTITVNSGFMKKGKDGKETEVKLTGKMDEILNQADKLYDDHAKTNPQFKKSVAKETFMNFIFNQSLQKAGEKMPKDKEKDANERAAKASGGEDKMPYTFGKKEIKL